MKTRLDGFGPLVVATAVGLLLSPLVSADNWPHWRGPERSGVSRESDLPLSWGPSENIVWKLPLPEKSGATPIVWGRRIFLNVADGREIWLWCVDADRGVVLWKRPLDDRNEDKRKGNLSSPSPVSDGSRVWAMTGTGVLTAFEVEGRQLWQRRLQEEYGKFGILHGYASSPLLVDGTLYVQVLHGFYTDDPSYLLAIDALSGKTRWRVERPTDAPREAPDAYTTPTLLESRGRREIVVSGGDYVTGHDLATGREIWRVGGLNPTRNPMQRIVASPIVTGTMLVVPSRVGPLLTLTAGDRPPGGAPSVVWSTERGPDVPTPAIAGPYLFIVTDRGIAWCLEIAGGKVVWGPERLPAGGTYSASPVVAAGRVYATNEEGTTTVLAAGPEFKVLAENAIDEYTLSSLAVAEGRIYLRTAEHLYAIGD